MATETAPELNALAKEYYAMLMQTTAAFSFSHVHLRRMNAQFGEEAVNDAMKPFFDAEKDAAQRRNWELIKNFYAEYDMAPLNHPDKPADAPQPYNLKELSSQPTYVARIRYCDDRFIRLGTGTARRAYDMGDATC